jgi:hypothetical protein
MTDEAPKLIGARIDLLTRFKKSLAGNLSYGGVGNGGEGGGGGAGGPSVGIAWVGTAPTMDGTSTLAAARLGSPDPSSSAGSSRARPRAALKRIHQHPRKTRALLARWDRLETKQPCSSSDETAPQDEPTPGPYVWSPIARSQRPGERPRAHRRRSSRRRRPRPSRSTRPSRMNSFRT